MSLSTVINPTLNAYFDALTTGQTKSINGPAFTRNGGITKIQRNGLRADGTYGKVDDLSIQYSGNRAMGVTDAAPVVTQNGSMDYPGGNTSKVLTYNAFGALVSDGGRGITSISYDNFGNPTQIQYSGSGNTLNTYSATGEKLKTEHLTTLTSQSQVAPMMWDDPASIQSDGMDAIGVKVKTTTEYHGPVIYRDGKIDMVLFPGGYATINGTAVTFHYYTQDYLGNNRAVINGSTGAVEQTVAYYPYGAVIADLGTPTTGQPYKFGGKELITANGLNEYDFGARQYYSALPAFTRIDPLCEDTKWLSPYLYCNNNPVNAIDPDGKKTIVEGLGEGRYQVSGGELDNDLNIYLGDENGPIIGMTTSNTSFYNSDKGKGEWAISSVIDLNDRSGAEFLNNLETDTPNLANYMWNARGNHKFDFKNTNGTDQKIDNIDQYRGMQIGIENGLPLITSARDIGNIGAGYMAGVNGISWDNAVTAFDAYQTYSNLSPSLQKSVIDGAITFLTGDPGGLKKVFFPLTQNKVSEGTSTRNAEKYGWNKGNAIYRRAK
ncbi:MAG: hypothetical protein K2H22_00960 [Muribaculaceae bacterium]|nr:hypothetical protein [Muribaculaceae bacterium]